ncbi:beta-ketoacyl synthase N-terminal-like domain-containing protein, partial [Streptomyces sp. NPDC046197]|uniref:beta-ketoacyl synthase N-terminal-like domain-containing protein n=1 Tax=Streptomyces sp. NPDC046197 TaxID=3154337 RepID=UPI0033F37529
MTDTTRTVATPDESIAVVGMSCRLPRADDPAAFWRLLRDGVEAVGETPAHRWDPAMLGSADAPALAHGAFLAHVDRFDAAFFGIGPAEAATMDPQQRLVLELAWEALEDARITPDRLIGSSTGVFVGAIWDDWSRLLHGHSPDTAGQYGLTGTHRGIIANRVSYALGLRGPSLTIDSAQSSSLVAVHAACASLRSGESTLALVGGVNLNLLPESAAALGRLGALSHDGHVRLLDAEASGTVRGEGGALLVLKPLRAALADGDRVVCVIRGSAVNNDGATDGLTTPNPDAQRAVILAACRRAAVDPTDLQYVELHGTGTPVGDPVEAGAVGRAAGAEAGRDDGPLRVGSVKTNLGHLEAAAGIVGLLKVALSLRHRALPPTLNHLRPHPDARLDTHHLEVQTEHGPWPHPERELVAGVNSWGIGGTNCHVVLSEAPAAQETSAPATDGLPCVWPVSARTGTALRAQADRLHAHLTGTDPSATSDQVGHALAVTRTAFRRRGAAVGTTRAELLEGLRALADGTTSPHLVTTPAPAAGPTPLAVLFGGGGSQRPGMGAELYAAHPVYAAAFDAVCDELDRHLPQPVRPLIFTEPDTPEARLLDRTDFALPALLAVEVALYRLYESWGLRPTHLTGHSMGELTAAHIAGVLSLPDVCELAAVRARLIQSAAGGAMAAVQASEDEVLAALDEFSAAVSIAGINAPDSTVISGDEDAVLELCARWRSRGRKTKRIAVTVAGHSPHMDGILDEFRTVARRLTYSPPRIPVISNVTGTVATVEQITDPEYWVRHVRATVRFADGLRTLHSEGVTTYLELSPSPVLAPAVGTCLDGEERRPVVITTLQRDRADALGAASALAALFTVGHDIDWSVVFPPGTPDCDLPTYAFQRRSHWPRFDTEGRPARAVHITGDVTETSEAEDEHPLAGLRGDALRAAVRDLVETAVTAVLGEDDDEPDGRSDDGRGADRTFKDRGFTSLRAVEMRDRLETATGLRLPAGLLFDHPTADALVEHLCRTLTGDADVSAGVAGGVVAVDEPLAIVGMACRFPGGVGGPEDLWRLVAEGRDVVEGFPADRGWDLERLFHPDPEHAGTSYARAGGFLRGAAGFDAEFFGISPREALAMDPQQRLLLETAWEALEHARIDPHGLQGSRTGVFTGVMYNDYASGLGQGESTTEGIDGYLLTGRSTSVASGRLAYVFGFEGPAVSVDTACSSSLVALHLAG